MNPIDLKFPPYKTSVLELKGGLNENVSSLELKGGELIDCKNYMIAEGGYGGYTSIKGYERVDGKYTPSEYISYILTLTDCGEEIQSGDTLTDALGATVVALEDGQLQSGAYIEDDAVVLVQARIGTGTLTTGR